MTDISTGVPSLILAIISRQYLLWLGLQKSFEREELSRIVMQWHLRVKAEVLIAEKPPDVFIIDMETERDPIGTIQQIRELAPRSKILLLSGFESVHRTREAFERGVDGVILNMQPPAVLFAAIRAMYSPASNRVSVNPIEAEDADRRALINLDAVSDAPPPVWPEGLSERKREIIRLIGEGLSNKDIADQLCIAESTVRHHLTRIFNRVGVSNRQKLLLHTHHLHSSPV
jgi:DNA-binding NarL/FixJ family response regulator